MVDDFGKGADCLDGVSQQGHVPEVHFLLLFGRTLLLLLVLLFRHFIMINEQWHKFLKESFQLSFAPSMSRMLSSVYSTYF